MQNLTTLVNNFQPVTTEKQLVPESAREMDRNEIDAIKYFFVKMEQTYRKKYSYIVGSPEEQKRLMAQFGSLLKSLTKCTIDTFFAEKQMSLVKNSSEWPDIYDLVGEVTGLRRNSEEAVKSWTYYLNRRIGEDWLDNKTFEVARRIGCGCNELIANQCNNNTEKAKNAYIEKYNALLTEIDNGFKLPELALVLEHKTGSNKNRTAEDKERAEIKKADFESGKPLEKRGDFDPTGWIMMKVGVWYRFFNGVKVHYVEKSGLVHLNGKQTPLNEFMKGVE